MFQLDGHSSARCLLSWRPNHRMCAELQTLSVLSIDTGPNGRPTLFYLKQCLGSAGTGALLGWWTGVVEAPVQNIVYENPQLPEEQELISMSRNDGW